MSVYFSQMETPVDVIRFSTTNRELDLESGIIRYDVNFECSHMFWRSVLDISRPERSFGVKFYSAPGNTQFDDVNYSLSLITLYKQLPASVCR